MATRVAGDAGEVGMKRFLTTAFYLSLSIMGLNFFVIALFVTAQVLAGQVSGDQLINVLRVLTGRAFLAVPDAEYKEWQAFRADKEKARLELREQLGTELDRRNAGRRADESVADLQSKLAIATAQLDDARDEVLGVRRQVEQLKQAVDKQQRMFRDEVARQAAVEMDRITRHFRTIVPDIDSTNMARVLEDLGTDEAVRMMRDRFPATYAAEVFDDLSPEARTAILPRLDNKFHDVPAEQLARMWTDRQYGATEIAMYLTNNMTAMHALGTFLALPPQVREELASLLLTTRAP